MSALDRALPLLAAARETLSDLTRNWPLSAWGLWTALFAVFSYGTLDRPVARLFKSTLSGNWEGFFKIVTHLGLGGYWIAPGVVVLLFCLWRRRRAIAPAEQDNWRHASLSALYFVLTTVVTGVLTDVIKPLVGRLRPRELFEQGLYGFHPLTTDWATNSFPSGHSQAIFSAMTALAVILPRYNLMWFALAVLVATSRVVTSVHYLSDVAAGIYIGVAGAVLFRRAFAARGIDVRLRLHQDNRLTE